MANIHISDLRPVSSEALLTDLTISEQDGVNGGGLLTLLKKVVAATIEFAIDIID